MTASHGRASRRGRPWLSTALVASGWVLGLGISLAGPASSTALACHIHHGETGSTASTTEAASASTSTSHPFANLMTHWDETAKSEAQVVAPSPSTMPVAPSSLPTVQNWHQAAASSCMPPPPPSSCGTTSPTASAQGVASSPPLNPPAAFLNPPAPAPEPSTIFGALALAGALAWRRRSARASA